MLYIYRISLTHQHIKFIRLIHMHVKIDTLIDDTDRARHLQDNKATQTLMDVRSSAVFSSDRDEAQPPAPIRSSPVPRR